METFWLFLIGCAVLMVIWVLRYVVKTRQLAPWPKRFEAIVRIVLCILGAGIVFAVYHSTGNLGFAAVLVVLASAFLIYGVTHLFDRLVLGD